MDKRNARNVRKRKRLQQKRRAWSAVALFFLCIMAASFFGGYFVGYLCREDTGGRMPVGNSALEGESASGMWEDMVYCDAQGNAVRYRGMPDENARDNDTDESKAEYDSFGTQWNLLLVNGWTPIPDHYEVNLVEVTGGEYVDERIYEPLMEMLEDAREANLNELPLVVSGYRTAEKQQQLYDEKISKYRWKGYSDGEAEELARQWVALPGHSEHQLGLAVDINGETYDVYLWMQENCYKYGFIFRYPGNKTEQTGIAEEVWHYRYVGIEAATEIYEQGICLEEYLDNIKQKVMGDA